MRTDVISGAPSAASAGRARTRPAAPASQRVVKKRRRVCIMGIGCLPYRSRLHLAFDLIEKPPVAAVGDDLLRARLDQARLAQAQRIEAERILGIVFAPFFERDLAQGLAGVVVTLGK